MINGGAKPLVFDAKFKDRPVQDQIEYLEKLAASQNHALDLMQQERNTLAEQLKSANQQVKNAEEAFQIQKQIVSDLVTQSNAEGQGIAERIFELEARVKAQDELIESFKNG